MHGGPYADLADFLQREGGEERCPSCGTWPGILALKRATDDEYARIMDVRISGGRPEPGLRARKGYCAQAYDLRVGCRESHDLLNEARIDG